MRIKGIISARKVKSCLRDHVYVHNLVLQVQNRVHTTQQQVNKLPVIMSQKFLFVVTRTHCIHFCDLP